MYCCINLLNNFACGWKNFSAFFQCHKSSSRWGSYSQMFCASVWYGHPKFATHLSKDIIPLSHHVLTVCLCNMFFFSGVRSSPRTNKKKSPSSQQKEEKNKKEQRSAADFFGAKKVAIGSKAAPSVSVLWMITAYRWFVSPCFRYAYMQPSWVKTISILISYCNTVDACDDEAMINPTCLYYMIGLWAYFMFPTFWNNCKIGVDESSIHRSWDLLI